MPKGAVEVMRHESRPDTPRGGGAGRCNRRFDLIAVMRRGQAVDPAHGA